ncbi:MAG: hypothetical protein K2Q06_05500 [Parvularculaceae bacterium]|nr:hypothetical protein [Parvularculaceae bacterium]
MSKPDEVCDDEATMSAGNRASDFVAPRSDPSSEHVRQMRPGDRGQLDVGFIILVSAAGWAAIAAVIGLGFLIARLLS